MPRSSRMSFPAAIALMCAVILVGSSINPVNANVVSSKTWVKSHATFYGGDDASGTMGGACGYGNNWAKGYGVNTAALSQTLFNSGASCGACFEIKCIISQSKWCYKTAKSVFVTATNLCPANWARSTDGWCNPPRTHFDLSYPMFSRLAQKVGGIIPIQFRRVTCVKTGGMRFEINGNPWFLLVLVYNIGGVGDVKAVQLKGSKTSFSYMSRNWGENWELRQKLTGQALAFRVVLSDDSTLTSTSAVNQYWRFGCTYECTQNFH